MKSSRRKLGRVHSFSRAASATSRASDSVAFLASSLSSMPQHSQAGSRYRAAAASRPINWILHRSEVDIVSILEEVGFSSQKSFRLFCVAGSNANLLATEHGDTEIFSVSPWLNRGCSREAG